MNLLSEDVIDLNLCYQQTKGIEYWLKINSASEYIDPNHQYTYPNSPVLINKQNITNIEEAY